MKIYQVDSFTKEIFCGNPAGVCLCEKALEASTMIKIAQEMNLSETAFLSLENFDLRWFTPKVEVELCGHATLATAHILWEQKMISPEHIIRFQTKSGELPVRRAQEKIVLDFPQQRVTPCPTPKSLPQALGVEPVAVYQHAYRYLVELSSEEQVYQVSPNFELLRQLDRFGIVITAPAKKYDFVSRFFAPAKGIPEDPVTGSAHCSLGPFWAQKMGKSQLTAFQASPRGGELELKVKEADRVEIIGQAVTVFSSTLSL